MRINCVPVDFLADQHLFAEYREIKMLPKSFLRSKTSKNGILTNKISKKYTLNTGHGYFFYDKLKYIYSRFEELKKELVKRNYNITNLEILSISDLYFLNDWKPTKEDMNVSLDRIEEKIFMKPEFYHYNHESMNRDKWKEILVIQRSIIKGV